MYIVNPCYIVSLGRHTFGFC